MQHLVFRITHAVLAVLLVAIIGGTAVLFGFTDPVSLPVPKWIRCSSDQGGRVFATEFRLHETVGSATFKFACSDSAQIYLDGVRQEVSAADGATSKVMLRDLREGVHNFRIEVGADSTDGAVIGFLDLPPGSGDRLRLVTDDSWVTVGGVQDAIRQAPIATRIDDRLSPFDAIPTSMGVVKGGRFWGALACLLVAMIIAFEAGPFLGPRAQEGMEPVRLAVVIPSFLYGIAAWLITAFAASDLGFGVIAGMHILATATFVVALIVWKIGSAQLDQDQKSHRAEIAGYDAMCFAAEMLKHDMAQASGELRASAEASVSELAEIVRSSSTGTGTPQLDQKVLIGIEALREIARDETATAAQFSGQALIVINLVRERELSVQCSRRA